MKEFWRTNFDKLLLSALFLACFCVLIHFVHESTFYAKSADQVQHLGGTIAWLENTVGQILAALLTLFVVRSQGTRTADSNGKPTNGAPSSPGQLLPGPSTPTPAATVGADADAAGVPVGWGTPVNARS